MDPDTFHKRYVKVAKPVVMREAVKNAPVVASWEEDANLKAK